jgi:hypothetical protein
LPRDFASVAARLRHEDDVVLMVCTGEREETYPLLVRPAPIFVPPLAGRAGELSRIINEYALDAIAELGAAETGFTEADHAWVRAHASGSLVEIERATLRLVAIARTATERPNLPLTTSCAARTPPRDGRGDLAGLVGERFPRALGQPNSRPPTPRTPSEVCTVTEAPVPQGAPPWRVAMEDAQHWADLLEQARWRWRALALGVLLALLVAATIVFLLAK